MRIFLTVLFILTFSFAAFAKGNMHGGPESGENAAGEIDEQKFFSWLDATLAEFKNKGISDSSLTQARNIIEPLPRVIHQDRAQPEFKKKMKKYAAVMVDKVRIKMGRDQMAENKEILAQISKQYGVPSKMIVSLWGIESLYGERSGNVPVLSGLATLAYEGRRGAYFTDELYKALKIMDVEHMDAADLRGSWAGAMGQTQFMPSSFFLFAVDQDKDGKRDIWDSKADALASIANYLHKSGWKAGQSWGQAVSLPAAIAAKCGEGLGTTKTMAAWQKQGVKLPGNKPLAASARRATLLCVGNGKNYLVSDNFRVILKWNRSVSFALSAGLLADKLGE